MYDTVLYCVLENEICSAGTSVHRVVLPNLSIYTPDTRNLTHFQQLISLTLPLPLYVSMSPLVFDYAKRRLPCVCLSNLREPLSLTSLKGTHNRFAVYILTVADPYPIRDASGSWEL